MQRRVVVSGGERIHLGVITLRAGGLDGDGDVDGADLALLASNWGRRG